MIPRVGQYLYASCAGQDYGKIIAVGQDANGIPTIDIEVFHPNDIISCDDDDFDSKGLEDLELPPGVNLILRNIQWKPSGGDADWIRCNTPANNCYRCTKLFNLRDTPSE